MRETTALIINPAAGRGGTAAETIIHELSTLGIRPRIYDTSVTGLDQAIGSALADGARRVLVHGGDGSVAAAAQQMLGTRAALGILPGGTMNLLARDLGIPLDLAGAARVIAGDVVATIDVGEVNGRVFLNSAFLGLPSRLQRHRESHRKRGFAPLLWWRMLTAAMATIRRNPTLKLAIRQDGAVRTLRTRAIAVANNAYDGGLGQGLSRSRLDRGELVLYVARPVDLLGLMRVAVGVALGDLRSHPDIEAHVSDAFDIAMRRPRARVMNDGEVALLKPPLRFRIRRKALAVIVPARNGAASPPEDRTVAHPAPHPSGALA